MAIDSGLKKSDGVDLGNNLFAGNGTSSGNQTFNIIMKNGVDLGRGWYNKSACYATVGNVGFKNASGVDVGTLLGKYGTLNCTCDVDNCDCDADNCDCDADNCDCDTDACFVSGKLLTSRGLVEVSEIVPGDMLWCSSESWQPVVDLASNKLCGRKVFELKNGGIVTEEHVVYQGQCAYSANQQRALAESALLVGRHTKGRYSVPSDVMQLDGAELKLMPYETKTYSPICEKSCIAYLNGERVLIAGQV